MRDEGVQPALEWGGFYHVGRPGASSVDRTGAGMYDARMPAFAVWAPYALGFTLFLTVVIAFAVDRLAKGQNRIVHLLTKIPEVREGAAEDAATDRIIRDDA